MRRSLAVVGALASVLTLFLSAGSARGQTAPALQPTGHAAPSDGQPPARPRRRGLLIGGVATFGVSYLLSVATAFDSLRPSNTTSCGGKVVCPVISVGNEGRDLLIPFAGPWMAMSSAQNGDKALLAFLGIAQAAGVAMTITGFVQYMADGAAEANGEVAGARSRASRPGGLLNVGVLPTRDGAFGFLSGRM